ncbi:PTS system, cellobiose-specific IIA component [Anaerovirgula multivorans]|uniref:PTS system, cellobiose-specific IIA component n=1 Tax=Anaerovirgula multivorans TaxID=312168 RepID=A0A239IR30_9FIRM|nr:PTS lactose/cellobiose transporter subunit IIA [Anaerovirgula multivorans]SNS96017.1 PTS system, cellobiose-specific IIA component [Anaerovirgula multivorans]
MNYEEIIMELIVNSGNARSKAMEAIQAAKAGNILEARELHKKAGAELSKAHQAQTQLIQDEATGNPKTITLLLIHAQDHLMNAMTIRDLAEEFIDMYENLQLQNHKREEKK